MVVANACPHRPMTTGPKVHLQWLQKRPQHPDRPVLFCVVRNEMYFLPHFLAHYRALGIEEFCFLDDLSDDGTLEYLTSQPDCSVLRANLRFGDECMGDRFGCKVKTLVPRNLFADRWVLTVDADEFAHLPAATPDFRRLQSELASRGLTMCRALMIDHFPNTLAELDDAPNEIPPIEACPWFDALSWQDWPADSRSPKLPLGECIRPRMFQALMTLRPELRQTLSGYLHASMDKIPFARWTPDMRMVSAHKAHVPASDQVQIALAHFKFYPGWKNKVTSALASKAYWNQSIEYQMLHWALQLLHDRPLQAGRSRRHDGANALEEAGLAYLKPQPATP